MSANATLSIHAVQTTKQWQTKQGLELDAPHYHDGTRSVAATGSSETRGGGGGEGRGRLPWQIHLAGAFQGRAQHLIASQQLAA